MNFRKLCVTVFIIKGFRTIIFIFIFIVIFTMSQPICPPAFFRCLSNSGTYTELRTTSFIESTRVPCPDSVNRNRVQVWRIPVLLLVYSQSWLQVTLRSSINLNHWIINMRNKFIRKCIVMQGLIITQNVFCKLLLIAKKIIHKRTSFFSAQPSVICFHIFLFYFQFISKLAFY